MNFLLISNPISSFFCFAPHHVDCCLHLPGFLIHHSRVNATELIADFKRWLFTSDASYMFASDRTLEMPQPTSPDVAKTDMLRCPRWLITHLVEARRNELKTETAWREMSAELNATKKKLTLATGQDEIKARDAIIKKLNASLQIMYRDVEEKTKELEETRAKAMDLAAKHSRPGRAGSGLGRPGTVPPEGGSSDQDTIKALREEIARLKTQAEFAPPTTARLRSHAIRPSVGSGNTLRPSHMTMTGFQLNLGGFVSAFPSPHSTLKPGDLPPPSPSSATEEPIAYAEAKHWMSPEHKRLALTSMLTDPEMLFVDVLGRAIAGGNDADACASYLISLYSSQDTLMDVLEHLIYTEVSRCKSVNTLFRGEELSSRVLRSFVRLNGFEYVEKVLGPLIAEVAANNYFYEVDPNRANPSMDLKKNFVDLEQLCERFLDSILSSYIWIPPEFLRLIKCIYSHSSVKFADENCEQLVVAGFMFLRFLGPAIAAPESFRLTAIETPEARRTLLLVGKILQNLANGAEFKEPYLQDMNAFLTKHAQRVGNFFRKLRTYPVEIDADAPYIVDLARSVYGRREKIKTTAAAENASDKLWAFEVVAKLIERVKNVSSSVSSAMQPTPAPGISGSSPNVGAPSSGSLLSASSAASLSSDSVASLGTASSSATSTGGLIHTSSASALVLATAVSTLAAKPDVVKCFANVWFDNTDLLSKTFLALQQVSTDPVAVKKRVAENIATLAYRYEQIGFVTRVCVQQESAPSAYDFLHTSFSKYFFTAFALNFAVPIWLAPALSDCLLPIISQNTYLETDPAKVVDPLAKARYNREEMLATAKKLANAILQVVVSSLASCPRPLWLFCNTLSLNTSQDVGQFVLLNLVVPFIENPAASAPEIFAERPRKEASRSLQIIADMIRNYANTSNVLVDNIPMSQAAWSDSFMEAIGSWAKSLPGYLSDARALERTTPEAAAKAAMQLKDFLNDHMGLFELLLEGIQSTHEVAFGIPEYMDSLTQPPPKDALPSSVSGLQGSAGRRSSIPNPLDPKSAAKRAKEDEKRAKEEDERKRKEEKKRKEEDEKRKKEEEKRKKEEDRKSRH